MNIRVIDSETLRVQLDSLLQKNPFISEEKLYSYIRKKLEEELSADFERYVFCDDYYPPVAEDYDENFVELLSEFCMRYGF